MNKHNSLSGFLKALGPGLIFAGASIGVSHIVQSTRAGASYGFALLWVVFVANIFKYPFFEFGPRYVAATGENLMHGYKKLGKGVFYLFILLTLLTMFPIQSAVTLVTTGLIANLLHWPYSTVLLSAIILGFCFLLLMLGKYPMLDKLVKIMIVLLGISTVVAFGAAAINGSQARPEFSQAFAWNLAGLSFLVAFIGWMPAPIDISVWHSIWCAERRKQTQHAPSMKEALFDFHLGYWGTMVMAGLFLSLGALVMFGTGETFSASAVAFTNQVITLYTSSLGDWTYPIIATAASLTMFSTTITCLDAFPRVMNEAVAIIAPHQAQHKDKIFIGTMLIVVIGSVIIIGKFIHSMKALVDLATTLSFLSAPILAIMNLKLVSGKHMPEKHKPSKNLIVFSWLGVIFLSGFAIFFIVWKYFLT